MQSIKSLVKSVALVSAALIAVGCSSSDDEEPKFATLQPINEEVSPRVLWSESVGDGIGEYFSRLSPVVEYGNVYAADRAGIVRAMDKTNGKKVWQTDLRNLITFDEARDEGWFDGLFASPFLDEFLAV